VDKAIIITIIIIITILYMYIYRQLLHSYHLPMSFTAVERSFVCSTHFFSDNLRRKIMTHNWIFGLKQIGFPAPDRLLNPSKPDDSTPGIPRVPSGNLTVCYWKWPSK
jgi:hypothetical protein